MLFTLLVTGLVLLGLWFIFRALGPDAPVAVDKFLIRHFPNAKPGLHRAFRKLRNQPDLLDRVPKVFTQPHILPQRFLTDSTARRVAQTDSTQTAKSQPATTVQKHVYGPETNRGSLGTSHADIKNAPDNEPGSSSEDDRTQADNSDIQQLNDKAINAMKHSAESARSTELTDTAHELATVATGLSLHGNAAKKQSHENDISLDDLKIGENGDSHVSSENIAAADTHASFAPPMFAAEKSTTSLQHLVDELQRNNQAITEQLHRMGEQSLEPTESRARLAALRKSITESKKLDPVAPHPDHDLHAIENRRLSSELISAQQQREKFVLQIQSLEERLRKGDHKSVSINQKFANTIDTQSASTLHPKPTSTRLFNPPHYKDDLKKIKGIGKVMEKTLNELGVTTFKQLGEFEAQDIQRVSDALAVFPGRIERDQWVEQARQFYNLELSETTSP